MSIAVFRSDYVTNCAASTSVRFDSEDARNRQLHIFAERYTQQYVFLKAFINVLSFIKPMFVFGASHAEEVRF